MSSQALIFCLRALTSRLRTLEFCWLNVSDQYFCSWFESGLLRPFEHDLIESDPSAIKRSDDNLIITFFEKTVGNNNMCFLLGRLSKRRQGLGFFRLVALTACSSCPRAWRFISSSFFRMVAKGMGLTVDLYLYVRTVYGIDAEQIKRQLPVGCSRVLMCTFGSIDTLQFESQGKKMRPDTGGATGSAPSIFGTGQHKGKLFSGV